MQSIKQTTSSYKRKNIDETLKRSYAEALQNSEFKKLVTTLKIKEETAIKYTSKLEETVKELEICSNAKTLHECKTKVQGYIYYPKVIDDRLEFNYIPCKHMKKYLDEYSDINSNFINMPNEIKRARMKDIHQDDAKRVPIIKWLTKFYKNYQSNPNVKGLYLNGSFGSGKTYMLSALLNELSKDGVSTIIIYYPELLRSLKESFETNGFSEKVNQIKETKLLMLDDIGAETATPWSRDEILGTILQYRMDNKMPTFFTSNLNLTELEKHFNIKNAAGEAVKSRRIIERIKQVSDYAELISENRRK